MKNLILTIAVMLMIACSSSENPMKNNEENRNGNITVIRNVIHGQKPTLAFQLAGKVEKGPFVSGSVSIDGCKDSQGFQIIDKPMDANGRAYVLPCYTQNSFVALAASGLYFDEVTGLNTTTPITLRAIIRPDDSVGNANVITTMIYHAVLDSLRKVEKVITNDTIIERDTVYTETFIEASVDTSATDSTIEVTSVIDTTIIENVYIFSDTTFPYEVYNAIIAENTRKVLSIFGFENYADSIGNPSMMSFDNDNEWKNLLLVVSAIIQKAGNNNPGEVAILMNRIATEIMGNGTVSDSTKSLIYRSEQIVPSTVTSNMSRYGSYDITDLYNTYWEMIRIEQQTWYWTNRIGSPATKGFGGRALIWFQDTSYTWTFPIEDLVINNFPENFIDSISVGGATCENVNQTRQEFTTSLIANSNDWDFNQDYWCKITTDNHAVIYTRQYTISNQRIVTLSSAQIHWSVK